MWRWFLNSYGGSDWINCRQQVRVVHLTCCWQTIRVTAMQVVWRGLSGPEEMRWHSVRALTVSVHRDHCLAVRLEQIGVLLDDAVFGRLCLGVL
jgi:hypothetical protein